MIVKRVSKFIYTTALDKIRKMTKRIKVIPGGSSAGKTYSILPILADMAIRTPNLSISVVSESMPHLRRGALRDFQNIMKATNRWVDSHFNKTNSVYTFSNGSYMEFFSVEDSAKLRGARRNILYVNECNNISGEAYTQLAMRTDQDIYLDYNPSNRFWIEDVLKSDEAEKLILTYKDNEALSQSVIDFLEEKRVLAQTSEYWKNWCRVYLDGQQGKLEGVVFDNWRTIDSIPVEAELIAYGGDFGYSNDPTTIIGVYKYNDSLVLDEVLYQTGLTNNDIARILKQEDIREEIYFDNSEPKSIRELKNYGLRALPTVKGRDSILYGIQLLQEKELLVTRRSAHIIEELERYMWKKDREGNTLNIPIDAFNHTIDAIRYVVQVKLRKRSGGRRFTTIGRY